MMKQSIVVIFGLLFFFSLKAQIITTNPPFPTSSDSVVITFDATQGDQGLKGFTGDIYAHTGVITNLSTSGSDWKYVKAPWTTNIPACKLKRIATDKYQLKIIPSIREFYGVPPTETILKMAFVFRNSDGSKQGKDVGTTDIFTKVYLSGLNISFILPATKLTIADSNQVIQVNIKALGNDSICLFQDGNKIKSINGQTLIDSIKAIGNSIHKLKAFAYKDTLVISDSVFYYVHGNTVN